MKDLVWLVLAAPLAGAVVNGVGTFLDGWNKRLASTVALLGSGLAMVFGYLAVWPWLVGRESLPHVVGLWSWIQAGQWTTFGGETVDLEVAASLQIDPLSAMMVSFVTFIGFLIHVYSVGYMHEEPRGAYARYFSYLNLFMFSMLTLVLGSNFLMMFVGWEGVGLCSYLLIGFYYDKTFAADAGKKAFVANRIGDFGFVLGMLLIFRTFGSLEYTEVFPRAAADPDLLARTMNFGFWGGGAFWTVTLATAIGLFLFLGACGKSAQIPLYVWLPDAMAGPTPVSALIHAATMVTAGVYMVTRTNVIYRISSLLYEHGAEASGLVYRFFHDASFTVAVVGAVTAFLAATIGLAQTDIKKVLAYSTVSQLGYMFLGCGVGAFTWGIFHVFTHAFFKACLFLGSGSVIHGMHHEQDITKMGGLWKRMPQTAWTMAAATVAIAGFPVASGFFSKDPILGAAFFGHHYGLWAIGFVTAGLTAFYMFRMMFLTFSGDYRGPKDHHPHESPKSMTVPLWILAAGSVVAGPILGLPYVFTHATPLFERLLKPIFPDVQGFQHAAHHPTLAEELPLMLASVAIAVVGTAAAWFLYFRKDPRKVTNPVAARFPRLHAWCFAKWKVDELYEATVIGPTKRFGSFLWDFDARVVDGVVNGSRHGTLALSWLSVLADIRIVDGLVNAVATVLQTFSRGLRQLQSGLVHRYALILGFGLIGLVSLFLVL